MKVEALRCGFQHVESGPLVRSSYHAHEHAAVAVNHAR
jgi:lipoic acid synthetase